MLIGHEIEVNQVVSTPEIIDHDDPPVAGAEDTKIFPAESIAAQKLSEGQEISLIDLFASTLAASVQTALLPC